MTNLFPCFLDNNPLTMLVLPQPLATGNLAATVTDLQNQGIPVFTYPLATRLTKLPPSTGAFHFAITGRTEVLRAGAARAPVGSSPARLSESSD